MKSPVSINLATGLFLFMKSGGRFSVPMPAPAGLCSQETFGFLGPSDKTEELFSQHGEMPNLPDPLYENDSSVSIQPGF